MKKIFLFLILFAITSCEKDDICAADTPTTPQLVIEFFNNSTTAPKLVTKLKIQEFGNNNVLGIYNESKIKIPLKADFDITKYSFTLNSDEPLFTNTDNLEFNYSRNTVYVSRACGFKTNFLLDTDKIILKAEMPVSPPTEWIKRIDVTKPNILNEDETHIKIYF
jgi:Family of unknown function (DUF6452)